MVSFSSLLQLFSLRTLHLLFPQFSLSSPPPIPSASEAVCYIPPLFTTTPPTSPAITMALADESNRIVQEFDFSDEELNTHVKEFLRQMDEGLHKEGTSLQQIPTYVTGVPNGTEKGLYLAVDLGGTNFRVCSIMLMVTPPLTSLTTRCHSEGAYGRKDLLTTLFFPRHSRSRSSSRSTMPTASTPTCVVATLPVLPRAIAMNISSAWGSPSASLSSS
uniref:Phosphotransferase n=1 Tax=Fusarium oxysporum (strain Fo5176) TaxID=660025 RepID=A0A0D2XGI8_FUSOF